MSDDTERLLYQDAQVHVIARCPPLTILLVGEVDITNSQELARTLRRSWNGGEPLVVDTGALTFVDLSGLRVLALPALPPEDRWIRLINLTPCQKRLLDLMGWRQKARARPLA
ncbi:STAS domain-containing protein [Nonomuraea sp. MCN248]|uniref:STAS domain-containing protein n=1 Tax=Nonomuraea corallina TaxID=2989783 RepID=A0ABT4S9F1_9ACTN|nr:STAS domain-containing protein [Nonomuraea corallina]MDA0633816.1 STAS domain-containing protein [Nonomuraea corallina]